ADGRRLPWNPRRHPDGDRPGPQVGGRSLRTEQVFMNDGAIGKDGDDYVRFFGKLAKRRGGLDTMLRGKGSHAFGVVVVRRQRIARLDQARCHGRAHGTHAHKTDTRFGPGHYLAPALLPLAFSSAMTSAATFMPSSAAGTPQ